MKPKVAIRKIESYDLKVVESAIEEFLASANPVRLKNASTVLIKPNLLGAFAPEQAVTTHPVVVEATIRYLQKQGKEVWLGDSPGGSGNTQTVWQTTGMQALAEKYSVKLVNFASFGVQKVTVNGYEFTLTKALWQADAVISISKYKTHGLMAYTGAIKNLYGLIPGLIKTELHKKYPDTTGFGLMLAELYKIVRHRVCYHILDGIIGMDGAGPSAGRPRRFGLLFGSSSAAALDYLAASFMGFKLKHVGYIKAALHEEGIIPTQIEYPLSFNNFKLNKVDRQFARIGSQFMALVPPRMKVILEKVFDFYPQITDSCKKCLICYKSCPVNTIEIQSDGFPRIIKDNCIRCLCCHEMCPYRAIDIYKSLVARFIMR